MLNDRDKYLLYSELAKLSEAGFPINNAVEAILDTRPPSRQANFLKEIINGLESNKSLTETIKSLSSRLSPLEISLINAGEKSGKIPEIFNHLSRYFSLKNSIQKKIKAGLIYPVLLLHFGIILLAIARTAQSRDFTSEAMNVITTLLVLYFICSIFYFGFQTASRKAQRSSSLDAFLNKIPILGKVRKSFALSRFTEILRTYLISSHSVSSSILAAAEASASGQILRCTKEKILPSIDAGNPVGPVLANEPDNFPPVFARAYITSEESGTLDVELKKWTSVFTNEAESSSEKMGIIFPKVAYLLIVVVVIWQIFKMANIYFQTFEKLIR
ncbi:MAG: type II secretion system F family protein [Verrucomicrobiota bacterium]|nr:type II secretion system F family protein [Verrucomicrobiota bacterium]